jgi:hypothetical protein
MGNKNNPGILVECNIRRMASRKYAFNALPPVKAKGYSEPVPIFEPLSPLERSWGRIQPNFVGRETEIKALMGMARDIVSAEEPHSRLVFVASQSGMGKSTMVAHAIEHIRNLIGDNTRRLVITKHVGKESHSLLPFGYVSLSGNFSFGPIVLLLVLIYPVFLQHVPIDIVGCVGKFCCQYR